MQSGLDLAATITLVAVILTAVFTGASAWFQREQVLLSKRASRRSDPIVHLSRIEPDKDGGCLFDATVQAADAETHFVIVGVRVQHPQFSASSIALWRPSPDGHSFPIEFRQGWPHDFSRRSDARFMISLKPRRWSLPKLRRTGFVEVTYLWSDTRHQKLKCRGYF